MSTPTHARAPSVHAHSPALLRQAIQSIIEERALLRRDPHSLLLSVVSHPPSPTSLDFPDHTESSNLRALNSITPLDFNTLERIPLSDPPRAPTPAARDEEARGDIKGEEDYPLIMVTGEIHHFENILEGHLLFLA